MKKYMLAIMATLSIAALSANTNPEKIMRKHTAIYGNFTKMKKGPTTLSITCKTSVKLCMVIVGRYEDADTNISYVSVLNEDGSTAEEFRARSYESVAGDSPEETVTNFILP